MLNYEKLREIKSRKAEAKYEMFNKTQKNVSDFDKEIKN
jgi:hypothetical protein